MSYVPDDVLHSFTSVFGVRPASPGVAATVRSAGGGTAKILITRKGGVGDRSFPPAKSDYREWLVYRSVLNTAEMAALQAGKLLHSSLEVYAPLQGEKPEKDRVLENRAQSMARVVFCPSRSDKDISRLEADIIRAENDEKVFVDPGEKKPVPLAPHALEACAGVYEVAPDLVLTVEKVGGRLFLLINGGDGGKTELFPLSEERFFVRSVGPEIEVLFPSKEGGRPDRLLFKMGGQEMTGKRKPAGLG